MHSTVNLKWPAPVPSNQQGVVEYIDSREVLQAKIKVLSEAIKQANLCCAYLGAVPNNQEYNTQPSVHHVALAALEKVNLLHHVVQTNPDGLLQKAGFPQQHINEVNGSLYNLVKPAGSLPTPADMNWIHEIAENTNLTICLGTPLRGDCYADILAVVPANHSKEDGSKCIGTVLVNTQPTPFDSMCYLKLWASLDDVFTLLAIELKIDLKIVNTIPPKSLNNRRWSNFKSFNHGFGNNAEEDLDLTDNALVKFKSGGHGRVIGEREYGIVIECTFDNAPPVTRTLGVWWILGSLQGLVPGFPVYSGSFHSVSKCLGIHPVYPHPEGRMFMPGQQKGGYPRGDATPPEPTVMKVLQSHQKTANGSLWGLRIDPISSLTIKQVKWFLHPTFNPPVDITTTPPFSIQRVGWGTFTVGAEIITKAAYGNRMISVQHDLTFDSDGQTVKITTVSADGDFL